MGKRLGSGIEKSPRRRRELLTSGVLVLMLGLLLLLTSLSVCSAQSQVFACMNITSGTTSEKENITLWEGNWIKLHGGETIDVPGATFLYNGFNETSYGKDGRTINITVNVTAYTDHRVEYPYNKHRIFYNDSNISISLENETALPPGTYYYYVSKTYPTELKSIGEKFIDGDTSNFRALFLNRSSKKGIIAPGEKKPLERLNPGDYVVIITYNNLSEPDFEIIAATGIEVLEYKSMLIAPARIQKDEDLRVTMNLTGAPSAEYRYGAALIKIEDYRKPHKITVKSDATKIGTELAVDNTNLIEDWKIVGVGLKNINASIVQDKILNILEKGDYSGSVCYKSVTTDISQELVITTEGLPLGHYILSVGVWQGTDKLVAFEQKKIEIKAKPTPTPRPPRVVGGAYRPPVTINVPVDAEGKVTTTTTLSTEKATLMIPAGIIVKDAEGNPLSTSITMLYTPATAERVGAITAYDFGTSGTTLSPPIDLVIAYDPADIPAGYSESDLVIKMYDGTAWVDLPTTVDTVAHTATAKVSHFTIFALFAAPPVAPPPTPTPTPTIPPPVTPTPTPPVVPPVKPVPWAWIIGIIIAVIVVGAVLYYFYTKKT